MQRKREDFPNRDPSGQCYDRYFESTFRLQGRGALHSCSPDDAAGCAIASHFARILYCEHERKRFPVPGRRSLQMKIAFTFLHNAFGEF